MVEEARGQHTATTPILSFDPDGSSGSGSGPAELPLVELGLTVPYPRPN